MKTNKNWIYAYYLIIFLAFVCSYLLFIYNPTADILKKKLENEFFSDAALKSNYLDHAISKSIEGAKSISSRSMIRNKIIDYNNKQISLEELTSYTQPKYLEGIRALDNCIYARRIIDTDSIAHVGKAFHPEIQASFNKLKTNTAKACLQIQDSVLITGVISPIKNKNIILGYDILCSVDPNSLKELFNARHNIKIYASQNNKQQPDDSKVSPFPTNDTLYYSNDSIRGIFKSKTSDTFFCHSMSQNVLLKELAAFKRRQATFILLVSIVAILLTFAIHQRNRLIYYKKNKLLEQQLKTKNAELNKAIEDLKQTNQVLLDSESRYKSMFFDNATINLLIDPETGNIEEANKSAISFYGYTNLHNLNINNINTLNSEDIKAEINKAVHKKKNYFEFKHKLANGEIRDVHVYSNKIKLGSKDFLHSIIYDVTNELKSKELLKQSHAEYKQLFDLMQVGVTVTNKEGDFINYNREAQRILNISPESFNGTNIFNPRWKAICRDGSTLPPEEFASVRAFKENRLVKNVEQGIINKNNTPTWLKVSAIPKISNDGLIISFIDISENVNNEGKLLKLTEELREANATKDKFFSIIAHDLRSPFTAILGMLEISLADIKEKKYDNIENYVGMLLHSTQKSLSLLENLLQWSRIQTGRMAFEPQLINVKQIAENITALFHANIEQKKIHLQVNIPPELNVIADLFMIEATMRNLVSNALKYSNINGEITIYAEKTNNSTTISVADKGIGIPTEYLDKIFMIEENISTPGTNNESGTGLGLILCKEFIEKHNGKIWAESKKGRGSIFSFTLP